MLPWQRDIYEQLVAAGPGAHVIWQGGRRGGKFMIKRALDLRAEQEKAMHDSTGLRPIEEQRQLAVAIGDARLRVHAVNTANGWFEDGRTFGDDVALLHTEVSEMFEAYRDGGFADQTAEPRDDGGPVKPEGVGSEAADILVRLLDTCERHDIDLAWEFERKLTFNATRGHKHGGKII
jgi:NTP pyrophosphatase (non-canonical NTP hydrolase)